MLQIAHVPHWQARVSKRVNKIFNKFSLESWAIARGTASRQKNEGTGNNAN